MQVTALQNLQTRNSDKSQVQHCRQETPRGPARGIGAGRYAVHRAAAAGDTARRRCCAAAGRTRRGFAASGIATQREANPAATAVSTVFKTASVTSTVIGADLPLPRRRLADLRGGDLQKISYFISADNSDGRRRPLVEWSMNYSSRITREDCQSW
jgi:hypothetical protein